MAKYKKRKDGRYSTSVTVGYNETGKPLKKTIYGRTIKEVDDRKVEVLGQLNSGTFILNDGIRVGEWALEWLKIYKSNKEYNTVRMYETIVNKYVVPNFGTIKLKDLRSAHIQALINELVNDGKIRTAHKFKVTINQIVNKAIENNLITRSPLVSIEIPVYFSEKRALTDSEKQMVENSDLTLKERSFIYVMLYAGLRKGEALALTKSDIDLKAKTITINKSVVAIGNQPETKKPKSNAGNRVIPMPEILHNILTEYLSEHNYFLIFPSEREKMMSHSAFRHFWAKIVSKFVQELGAKENKKIKPVLSPDITPHIFRHTYATTLYYAGVDIKTCQYLMGHSSIRMTMEIYTHLDVAKNVSAADKINLLLSSQQVVNKKSDAL